MTTALPSRPLLGARRAPYVPSYATDITVTWAKARRLQSLRVYRSQRDSADEAAAMRQIEADQQAAGYVPEPVPAPDFNTLPF